jgi:signal transduction histidine kinase
MAADVRLAEEIGRRAALALENAQLYRAAQHAKQVRDEVLGIVAHDLRNPLGNVLMQAELLRRPGDPDRRSRKPADALRRAALRMQYIIEDLLDVTQLDAGQLALTRAAVFPLELIAEVVAGQAEVCAVRSLELRQSVPAKLPALWIDQGRVLQVFENLVGNAVKFTTAGSITLGAKADEHGVLFWVADTGAGISKDAQPHLFDRFWQARANRRAGAGLGLAIGKGIVEVAERVARAGATFSPKPVSPHRLLKVMEDLTRSAGDAPRV